MRERAGSETGQDTRPPIGQLAATGRQSVAVRPPLDPRTDTALGMSARPRSLNDGARNTLAVVAG
jgi:hypothetical protein